MTMTMVQTRVSPSTVRPCTKVDPEIFFDPEREHEAVALCNTCPARIRHDCLMYAVNTREPWGVWGGMTESERRNLYYARHRVKCPGCDSYDVEEDFREEGAEICRACGLSWRV